MPDLIEKRIAYVGFCGPIDSSAVTRLASAMNTAVNNQYDEIYLCFSSAGGYVGDGIFLYNHIRSLPIPITMHNTGTVASISTTLFVAGETRYCAPHTVFMMHPVTIGAAGSMASEPLKASLDAALCDEARTEAILRERTSIPEDILSSRRTRDVYLTAEKAVEYGLVTEIKDFRLPTGNQIFQV